MERLGLEVRGTRIGKAQCLHEDDSCDSDFDVSSDEDCEGSSDNSFENDVYPCYKEEVGSSSRSVHCVWCFFFFVGLTLICSYLLISRQGDRLNLDVTAMIAYVSSLTNGGCQYKFKEPLLTQQAEWERKRPAKPMLDQIFQGNKF